MKVAITSDLHLPITPATTIADLARRVAAAEPDALVLAGDVAESHADLAQCLEIFTGLVSCPVWVLAGNHDLWARHGISSRRLFEERLPEIVQQAGCHWLEGKSFHRDGVGVVGTIAWYDYSAADPGIDETPKTFAEMKRYFNMDATFLDWDRSDEEFAAQVAGPFLAELDRLEADPSIVQTVVITHVPLLEEQMARKPKDRDWGFANAYFGNLTLGREVLRRRKVVQVLSGHTHVGRDAQLHLGGRRVVRTAVLPSDYGNPAWMSLSFE